MSEQPSVQALYQALLARNQHNLTIIRKFAKYTRKNSKRVPSSTPILLPIPRIHKEIQFTENSSSKIGNTSNNSSIHSSLRQLKYPPRIKLQSISKSITKKTERQNIPSIEAKSSGLKTPLHIKNMAFEMMKISKGKPVKKRRINAALPSLHFENIFNKIFQLHSGRNDWEFKVD